MNGLVLPMNGLVMKIHVAQNLAGNLYMYGYLVKLGNKYQDTSCKFLTCNLYNL